ncbi:hypothetical protein AVEN_108266-1 [Araneus ventricosus]|uniref:Uncharacterized protein n=1 Tax=Araneus ventricosus TaxID=182803 RepID=A0A4Y2DVP1_ARAVE|nr:hypothetical protein AVEN_108266-1 [Araneus ventricosus]
MKFSKCTGRDSLVRTRSGTSEEDAKDLSGCGIWKNRREALRLDWKAGSFENFPFVPQLPKLFNDISSQTRNSGILECATV